MTKSQKRYPSIEIIDNENVPFFMIKNEVMTEYRPIIGSTGMDLYCFYKQMANRKKGETLYPSMQLIGKYLGMAKITISCYNWLLECCGLLKIETGNARINNRYTLLPVNPVTPELLAKLTEVLQPDSTDGVRWGQFKALKLKESLSWEPLHMYFREDQSVFSTNGSKPKQDLVEIKLATAESDELVQQLVEYFADNKPKLTKESAKKMILAYGAEKVQQQLEWLDQREIDDNPLKTLRASLKFDWLAPDDEPGELEPTKTLFDDETRWIMPPPPTPLQEKWDRVQLFLKTQVISSTFNSLFQQTELVGIEGDVWIIQCESEQQKAWIEHRWMDVLYCSVASVAGEGIEIQFVVVVKEKVAWIPPSQRK